MQPTQNEPGQERPRYSFGAIFSLVTGLVVVVVGLSVVLALFGGLWLDRVFGTKPVFTVLFIVAAGPLSLYLVYRLTMAATSRLKGDLPASRGGQMKPSDEGGDDE